MSYISKMMDTELRKHIKETDAVRGGARPVANQKSRSTGHDDFPPAIMYTGSSDVFINGMPISRRYDLFKEHSNEFETHNGMLYHGSDNVFVNELPVCRMGDRLSLTFKYSEDTGSINDLLRPKPTVCQPEVGVGGTEMYPSLHIHKEDEESDEFTYLSHPLLSLCWSLYYNDHRMPFISGVGVPTVSCTSAIMTGSDDVNVGRFEEQIY